MLSAAVARGVGFLAERQLPWGEHVTYISSDPTMQSDLVFDSSPFATTFIMHALRSTEDPRAPAMIDKAAAFLLDEAVEGVCWSYWASRNRRMIQPDLDDTATVSFALRQAGALVRNRELCLDNKDAEGLFVTWLKGSFRQKNAAARELWQLRFSEDVCCCVNANVVLHLGEGPDTAPAIAFLNDVANGRRPGAHNVYYLEELAFPYMVSRAFASGVRSLEPSRLPLLKRALAARRADGSFGSVLATALAISTVLNLVDTDDAVGARLRARLDSGLGEVLGRAADALLAAQGACGGWPTLPFYVGPYCGSAELTTGLCVEALARLARRR